MVPTWIIGSETEYSEPRVRDSARVACTSPLNYFVVFLFADVCEERQFGFWGGQEVMYLEFDALDAPCECPTIPRGMSPATFLVRTHGQSLQRGESSEHARPPGELSRECVCPFGGVIKGTGVAQVVWIRNPGTTCCSQFYSNA